MTIENDDISYFSWDCEEGVLLPKGFCSAMPKLESVNISSYRQRQNNEKQRVPSDDGQSDSEASQ